MTESTDTAMPGPPYAGGTFVSRFVWLFQSPRRLFEDIAGGAPWWQPWVWVSLINMVIAYLSLPIQIHLMGLNPRDLPPEQLEQTLESMAKFGHLGLISTPVVVLLTSLIISAITYIAVSVMAESAGFKKYLTLYMYSSVPASLGLLLGTIMTRLKGVESLRSIEDAVASFGPAMFVGAGSPKTHAILGSLDLFYIWFYILVGAGVMQVFGLGRKAAALVVVPLWLVYVLISLVSARASGLSG